MADAPSKSAALDPKVPNVARMYDYMLGGKENYASDRTAVEKLIELEPAVPRFARLNREFLGRAVRFVAGQGVSQFLDVGAGLPTQESVHEVARAVHPDARIAYVDNDPVVLTHSRALLGAAPNVAFVPGDIREPAGILGSSEISSLLDIGSPICVLLVAILHFVRDAEDPAGVVATLRDALAPGSYLIMSHGTAHGAPPDIVARSRDARRVYDTATAQITYREPAEVSRFLNGFSLVEPGLVHISQWRPPEPVAYEFDGFLAAVGRKD
ncbi:MAG TPA: SAM-dependent methyltransferase [Streptosporangiaceae bacterium]|nr:SAM-dependent methyltransferase [Streptosporangiaceae bacterium]